MYIRYITDLLHIDNVSINLIVMLTSRKSCIQNTGRLYGTTKKGLKPVFKASAILD